MGRTTRKRSLAILGCVLDSGIRHFDTAPLYGYGEAEEVLGEIIGACRENISITTKVGFLVPKSSYWLKTARTIARGLVTIAPQLRSRANASAKKMIQRPQLTPKFVEDSVFESLRKLRTEYIDVLLLHEGTAEEVADASIREKLESLKAKGVIKAWGLGSEPEHIVSYLHMRDRPTVNILQFENNSWNRVLDLVRMHFSGSIITHRSLGLRFAEVCAKVREDPGVASRWSREVGIDVGDKAELGRLLLACAVKENDGGAVLFSSMNESNIIKNAVLLHDPDLYDAEQFEALRRFCAQLSAIFKGT